MPTANRSKQIPSQVSGIKLQLEVSDDVVHLDIFDYIVDESSLEFDEWLGFDTSNAVTFPRVNNLLRQHQGKSLSININSGGGNSWEGVSIYQAIKNHKAPKTVNVYGMAASAASIIALSAKDRVISDAGQIMIHDPAISYYGSLSLDESRKVLHALEQTKESVLNVYEKQTNRSKEQLSEMMSAETYLTAQEALDFGFVTEIKDVDEMPERDFNLDEDFEEDDDFDLDLSALDRL